MYDVTALVDAIHRYVWGAPLLILLIGTALYLTVVLRGLQFRYLWYSINLVFQGDSNSKAKGDISSFQSLMTAMASAVGTGSIVGVAIAVTSAGVGVIFWLWVTSLITMIVKYSESLLAVKYRVVDKRGEMSGGPMYYIEKGLGWKWLSSFYAGSAIVATFGTGNLVQVNSIADAFHSVFHVDPWITGLVLAAITAIILMRGIKSIGVVVGVMVPVMALLYIAGGALVLIHFSEHLPAAIQLIISSAFTGQAAIGGFVGSTMIMAMQMGVARSVFSSEAGLGISAIAAAAAKTESSGRQALLAMTGTVLSTAIICTVTVLAIIVSGVLGSCDGDGVLLNGASLAMAAFEKGMPGGVYVVMIGLVLFAYSTVIAWAYYGEKCVEYLFGEASIHAYRIVFTMAVALGSVFTLELVWSFSDIMNGIIIFPNMIALIALSKTIRRETDLFLEQTVAEEAASRRVNVAREHI